MTAQTRVSAKGQVVIPKDVRDRLAWPAGTPLDVEVTPSGVMLRRARQTTDQDLDDAIARLQATVNYQGPYISEEEWKVAIEEMFMEKGDG